MTVLNMDCIEGMRLFPDAYFDSIVTDPPYELGFMGKSWDASGIAYSVEMWTEALRVLKPGGHLLAFSGSRTYHRMVCAIEDAGFEIRDQIMWVYGSGFPKSLDVSKAIDKQDAADARLDRRYRFTEWFSSTCALSKSEIDRLCGTADMARHWTDCRPSGKQPDVPTRAYFEILRSHIGAVPDWVEALVDERTVESENFKARAVVGHEMMTDTSIARPACAYSAQDVSDVPRRSVPITQAHTEAARQWQGWGTALKPAHEPIVVARKPLTSLEINVLARVESELRARGVSGKITWKNAPANDAAKKSQTSFSSSIEAPPAVATSAKSADENVTPSSVPKNAIDSASGAVHGQLPIGSESPNLPSEVVKNYATTCSTTTVESAHAAVKASDLFSLSITLPAGALRTAAQHSARSTPSSDDSATPRATECFAGIATGLTGSMEIAHIEQTAPGLFLWPHGLPKKVEAKPLTVAANVLQHGTGAINVDGCRVAGSDSTVRTVSKAFGSFHADREVQGGQAGTYGSDAGRWPANLIHDGSDEVLAAFPQDAARFYYAAKASKADRNEGLDGFTARAEPAHRRTNIEETGDNPYLRGVTERLNTHPTVKPTDLMRYLCRLVTPPGGTVLDPFTGSGSTGKAARLEGFGFIGFELSEEYTRIATARIAGVTAP